MPAALLPYASPCLIEQGQPAIVVNAATGTGSDNSFQFCVSGGQSGFPQQADFSCTGTYSVCTASLQQSLDGGVSFQAVGSPVDLAATKEGNLTSLFSYGVLVPGVLYLINLETFTGTSITISLAVS